MTKRGPTRILFFANTYRLVAKRKENTMHMSIQMVRNALAYASFKDKDVEKALQAHLTAVGVELLEEQYEEGATVETTTLALEQAMNDSDIDVEKLDDLETEGDLEDLDDEAVTDPNDRA